MTGVSGCFGGSNTYTGEVIDNIDEVSVAVDDIVCDTRPEATKNQAAYMLVQHYAYMEQRVRMITWAVVALAIVVLLKEF